MMSEGEAIDRLKRGDISGLECLVQTYQLQAVRTAYFITHDRTVAEDIVQTAFLRAYERIVQFDSHRPFGPWFLRGVINDALKAVTRNQHLSLEAESDAALGSLEDLLARHEHGYGDDMAQADLRHSLREALKRLSPPQRAVIVQRYYLGWSETEIAAQQAWKLGTVKSRLHAARNHLRLLLGDSNAS